MNKNADFSNHKHTQCYRSKHWTEKIWRKKATKIWPQTFNSNWYNQLFSIWKPITNYISRVKTHIPPASSLLLLLPHLIVWSRPLKSHFGQQLGKNIRGGPSTTILSKTFKQHHFIITNQKTKYSKVLTSFSDFSELFKHFLDHFR